jgi:mono/diheme cytochrome c family protein
VLVVVAAGVLTSIEPARQVASREAAAHGIQLEQQVDTTHVAVAVQPGTTGTNRIVVDLTDQRGRPVTNATVVSLRVQFAGADLGATSVTAQHTTGNEYVADGVLLSLVGRWQIEALVTRPDALDARAAWRFDVAAPGTGGGARFEPSTTAGDLAWAWEVILLGGLLLAVTNTWWERDRVARSLNVFGGVAVLAGVVMWFGLPHAHVGPPPVTGVVNPIAPTEASIAAGKTVYQTNCVTCHGVSGAGDGPDAAGLDPPPADLITHVPLHSDGDLFSFIANGFPRTAMPAWKGTLTDEQMWNVVNYLRTLGAGPPTAVTPTGTGTGTASPPAASATATPTPAGTRP